MALTMNDTRSAAIFSVLFIGVIAIQKKNHHIYAFGLLESLIIVDRLLLLFYFLTKLVDANLHNAIVVMSPIFTLYF